MGRMWTMQVQKSQINARVNRKLDRSICQVSVILYLLAQAERLAKH
jgi:hypothetical protein